MPIKKKLLLRRIIACVMFCLLVVGGIMVNAPKALATEQECAIMHSMTATFSGEIQLNFYCVVPDSIATDENAYAVIGFVGEVGKSYLVRDAKVTEDSDSGVVLRKFSFPVVVKKMQNQVVFRLYDGSDNLVPLRNGAGTADFTETGFISSIMTYCDKIIEKGSKMKDLAQAAKDYGKAAQIYFGYRLDDPEMDIELSKAVTDWDGAELFEGFAGVKDPDENKPEGLDRLEMTVVFEEDHSFRVYYVFDAEAEIDPMTYEFEVDKKEASLKTNDKGYYLEVKNISAKNLNEMHEFVIRKDGQEYKYQACGLTYARAFLALEEKKANLGKAMYLYWKAAKEYFSKEETTTIIPVGKYDGVPMADF